MEHLRALRLLDLPDRRVLGSRTDPSFAITIPRLLSWMATGSFNGKVQGLNQLQTQEQQ